MKRLALITLLAASCQSTSQSEAESGAQSRLWLLMRNGRFEVSGGAADVKSSPELDPILKAAHDLQWDKVKVLAEAHLQRFPGNKDGLLLLSLAYSGLGDSARSRFFAELVLKGHPGNAFALNILGLLKKSSAVLPEDNRQALVYFQLAQQAAPQNPIGALNSAYLNLELGNFQEARSDFKLASTKCDDCNEARIGSALSNQALGLFDEAKIDIDAVLAREGSHPVALLLLATQSLYLKKEYDESRKLLTALLDNVQSGSELRKEVRTMLNRMDGMAH